MRGEEVRSSECYLGKGLNWSSKTSEPGIFFNEERSVCDDRMTREEKALDLCGMIHESEIADTWRSTPCLASTPLFCFLSLNDHAVD